MEKNSLKKKILQCLKEKTFFIEDEDQKLSSFKINKFIEYRIRALENKTFKKDTIAIIYNNCGIFYWLNILVGIILDTLDYTDSQFAAADFNGDSIVNILDIVQIVAIILN